jgi:hypothetical protein
MTMRTTLLLLSTLAIVAACAQDGSTSPASRGGSVSPSAATRDATPIGQGQPSPNAKPIAPLTTVTEVHGDAAGWDGVAKIYGASIATCPDGAHVTGGGYTMDGVDTAILYNAPYGPSAWRVYGVSHSPGGVTAYALCVQ